MSFSLFIANYKVFNRMKVVGPMVLNGMNRVLCLKSIVYK